MKAYITLLSNQDYYPGVVALWRALQAVRARYPLYCLLSVGVGSDVETALERAGVRCIRLERTAVSGLVNPNAGWGGHWNYTFDKLLVWEQTQFEKLVFLDSDMLILRNIDELFDREPFSAVVAGASYPGNESWTELNSGLMVIEPDKDVTDELLQLVVPEIERAHSEGRMVGDQDVIKRYLTEWKKRPELHLDEGYNLFAEYLGFYVRRLGYSLSEREEERPVRVVHFIGKAKPWMPKNARQRLWLWHRWMRDIHYAKAYYKYKQYLK